MINTNFFLKDTASLVSGAISTFSGLKNEIDNLVKSRFEKFINVQGLVSREDFEALIDRHDKLNAEFNLLKIKLEKKTPQLKHKIKK